jgi:hypothetical protein
LAAKREERIRRERGDARGTSGERASQRQQDRPVSDSVPAGSILDRLGYVPADGGSAALPETALRSDTWSTTLGGSAEWLGDDGATEPPPQTLRDQLSQSGGFYSRVVPSVEEVTIPGPPRLPDLDPKDPSESPPPGSDTPPMGGRSGARSPRPEAVFIPPLLRRQAEDWQRTGSLTLPNTVSSRHARALQRALLLSMLQATEFSHLPEGIAQRAAWMFREGWGQGKKERDADDLCFVLGLTSGAASRSDVITAATAHIPAESILPPSSARWSSRPPRPDR